MKNTYPQVLLPTSQHTIISCDLSKYFLLRKTPNNDLIHASTGLIKDEMIVTDERGMLDYSTNLFGYYTTEHLAINLGISKNKDYFHLDWIHGSDVKQPIADVDYCLESECGFFFIPINRILEIKGPFKKGDDKSDYEYCSKVIHRPTNSNFWHFEIQSIQIKPDTEEPHITKNKGKWQKLLSSSLKSIIRNFIILDKPETLLLPVSEFTNN